MQFACTFALAVLVHSVDAVGDRCHVEEEICFGGEAAIRNISGVNSFEKCCDLCNGAGDHCAAWTVDYDKKICHLFYPRPTVNKKGDNCDAGLSGPAPKPVPPGPAPSPPAPPGPPPSPPAPGPHPGNIKVLPLPESLSAYKKYFSKYVPIFGIPILAESGMPDWMVEHAGNIMAQYLDYNADGLVDNDDIVASMKKRKATLIMFVDPDGKNADKASDAVGDGGQDLDKTDIPSWVPHTSIHHGRVLYGNRLPQCSDAHRRFHGGAVRGCNENSLGVTEPEDFDASLEEILHLITDNGYAAVYPTVFGAQQKAPYSEIETTMNDMVGDCGWSFNHTLKYPKCKGKFHYDDDTCDYSCLVTEYTMWTLTSILGGQDGSHNDALKNRCTDIADEWAMCTKKLVETGDPRAFAIFDVDGANQYKVPNKLPDGSYRPTSAPTTETMALDVAYFGPTHLDLGSHTPLLRLTNDEPTQPELIVV